MGNATKTNTKNHLDAVRDYPATNHHHHQQQHHRAVTPACITTPSRRRITPEHPIQHHHIHIITQDTRHPAYFPLISQTEADPNTWQQYSIWRLDLQTQK